MQKEHSLIDVPVGGSATVTGAAVDAKLARRLRELGLRRGAAVTVTQKTTGGGRVVRIRDTHYALGAFALKHITVDPEDPAAAPMQPAVPVEARCADCPAQGRQDVPATGEVVR